MEPVTQIPEHLVAKLAEVMAEVKPIERRGTMSGEDGEFRVASASDVFDAVRQALAQRRVMLFAHPQEHAIADGYVTVRFDFQFVDGEHRESYLIENVVGRVAEAEGTDKGVQSAYTIALKSLLQTTFLISSREAEDLPAGTQEISGRITSITQEGEADDPYWSVVIGRAKCVCNDAALAAKLAQLGPTNPLTVRILKKPNTRYARILNILETAHGN